MEGGGSSLPALSSLQHFQTRPDVQTVFPPPIDIARKGLRVYRLVQSGQSMKRRGENARALVEAEETQPWQRTTGLQKRHTYRR